VENIRRDPSAETPHFTCLPPPLKKTGKFTPKMLDTVCPTHFRNYAVAKFLSHDEPSSWYSACGGRSSLDAEKLVISVAFLTSGT